MSEVDSIQSVELENSKLKRLLERLNTLNRFISQRVQLDRENGILRITLEINFKKSLLFRWLAESTYIELFLLLVENSAIKYSVLFSRLALLSRILERNVNLDGVDKEKWNRVVSNFYEILQVIPNLRGNITSKNVNDILVPLNKTLDVVRNWSSDMFQSKPMPSKL